MSKLSMTERGREELKRMREGGRVPIQFWPQHAVLLDLELRGEVSYENLMWPSKDTCVGRRLLASKDGSVFDWLCGKVDILIAGGYIKEEK